ncbi:MAG: C4-dicarboxylate ABC transporter [Rhodobacteraceae bacterium]|nr:MAG: C4-dicarboxylate ABC transporter [Paracoccaceae bacterium]
MKRVVIALLVALLAAPLLWGVWQWSYSEALDQLEVRGRGNLSLASDRLVSQFARYRQLPVVLSDNPVLRDAVVRDPEESFQDINIFLEHAADVTGALDILLLDRSGTTLAAANWRDEGFIGMNFAERSDFVRAMNGALGFYHSQENADDPRGFYFTTALRDDEGSITGGISVKVDLEVLEVQWRGDPEIIFFTDANGVIFIANRHSLLLRVYGNFDGLLADEKESGRYVRDRLKSMFSFTADEKFGRTRWMQSGEHEIPQRALYLKTPLPVIGMTGNILLDLKPVEEQARLRTALAAAALVMLWLLIMNLLQRRRTLADRLEIEEKATAELEMRVAERTAQLQSANEHLVQAGKLAALGQMSAGISHELNQPLAAIQSYAENAVILLERDRGADASKNLGQISSLAGRMGRIIRNLRAFARKEGEPATRVDLVKVVEDTLELAGIRLREKHVVVHWKKPAAPVFVNGGGVRLQQVVLNLISNATDAMEGQDDPQIWIDISRNSAVYLQVRDNGPGLIDKDKIFEPFYTTKPVGEGDGMGLGLSISYGIVQSFGGQIVGENHRNGGAVFRIELTPAEAV